jgi:hypothetical protein
MSETIEQATARAEAAAHGDLLGRILEATTSAATRAVFGEPIERDGRTVITVARCRYGFGGGRGGRDQETGDGAGAGVMADPVGYIEIGPAGAEFRPIGGERPSAPLMLAMGLGAWLALSGVARVLRSLRR